MKHKSRMLKPDELISWVASVAKGFFYSSAVFHRTWPALTPGRENNRDLDSEVRLYFAPQGPIRRTFSHCTHAIGRGYSAAIGAGNWDSLI